MSSKKSHKKFKNHFTHPQVHAHIELMQQPNHICAICEKPISYISDSLISKDGEGYVHFDCAIRSIVEKYDVKSPQKVSYIGAGKFGIIEYIKPPNSFKIKEVIEWESADNLKKIREEVESLKP